MPTYSPKAAEIERAWYVVDADGMVLGRLATDHVVVVNADKVVLTAGKAERKVVYRHSGYPGGLKSETYARAFARKPEDALRRTIRGMLPKTRLGRQQLSKLKIYTGPHHPHAAQQPQALEVAHARRTA